MVGMKTTRTIITKVTLDRASLDELLLRALNLPKGSEVIFIEDETDGCGGVHVDRAVIQFVEEEKPQELTSLSAQHTVNDLQEK